MVPSELTEDAGEGEGAPGAIAEGAAGAAASELLSDDDEGGVSGGEAQSESMTSQGAGTAETQAAPDESTESVVAAS